MVPPKATLFNLYYSAKKIGNFKNSMIYKTNRMDMRELYDSGRLIFLVSPGKTNEFNHSFHNSLQQFLNDKCTENKSSKLFHEYCL